MSVFHGWFEKGFVPEEEDPYHTRAVQEGVVPEGCLQGGSAIWTFYEKGIDICQLCAWPRRLCRGRPQRKDGVIETRYDQDMTAANTNRSGPAQMRLRLWITAIEKQLDGGIVRPKRRKDEGQ